MQVLLSTVVFYMTVVAAVLYCSSNKYVKKGKKKNHNKTLQREEDTWNCTWWEMETGWFRTPGVDPW